MATKILAGAVIQANAIIAGIDADSPPVIIEQPSFTVTFDHAEIVREGETVNVIVDVSNLADGNEVTYAVTHFDPEYMIDEEDVEDYEFNEDTSYGTLQVTNGKLEFTIKPENDFTSDGPKLARLYFWIGDEDYMWDNLASYADVHEFMVHDPFGFVSPTFTVANLQESYEEGEVITVDVSTTNITDGTTLFIEPRSFYDNTPNSTNRLDFDEFPSFEVEVQNNSFQFSLSALDDGIEEGTEVITFSVYGYYGSEEDGLAAIGNIYIVDAAAAVYEYPLAVAEDPTSATWRASYAPAGYTFTPNVGITAAAPITNMGLMFKGNATFNADISSWVSPSDVFITI